MIILLLLLCVLFSLLLVSYVNQASVLSNVQFPRISTLFPWGGGGGGWTQKPKFLTLEKYEARLEFLDWVEVFKPKTFCVVWLVSGMSQYIY